MSDTPNPKSHKHLRIMFQHTPTLFSLGKWDQETDPPLTCEYRGATYYRSKSTPRWVLYKRAVKGHGEMAATFDPRQQ